MVNNKNQVWMNSEVHNINTRNNSDFYQPSSYLIIYQKGLLIFGIRIYNSHPLEIKDLSHNIKKFKSSLSGFLRQHSIYTLKECLDYKAAV